MKQSKTIQDSEFIKFIIENHSLLHDTKNYTLQKDNTTYLIQPAFMHLREVQLPEGTLIAILSDHTGSYSHLKKAGANSTLLARGGKVIALLQDDEFIDLA